MSEAVCFSADFMPLMPLIQTLYTFHIITTMCPMGSCCHATIYAHRTYDPLDAMQFDADLAVLAQRDCEVPEWTVTDSNGSSTGLELGTGGAITVNQEVMASSNVSEPCMCSIQ